MTEPFTWRDGERTIAFGRGRVAEAGELLGTRFLLLTTERARGDAPGVAALAAQVVHVARGQVDALAGELLEVLVRPRDGRIVALGGGRVIDVAKAVASAWDEEEPGWSERVGAVPTTLSAAQMTHGHRQAPGRSGPFVRPTTVLDDPALSASQPAPELAASALNALGHAFEAPMTTSANPVSTLAAVEAARLIVGAWRGGDPDAGDRDALALGALLSGYALDASQFGLHHVAAQTLARYAGVGHGQANAIMLPHTLGALGWRFPAWYERLTEAVGGDPAEVAGGLCALTPATRLGALDVDGDLLDACADAAAERSELELTPPRADRAELRALYEHAR
ncbi:MAG: iron-containing alcohol dehydrogenase [Solirubrobacteraceae bacterium]